MKLSELVAEDIIGATLVEHDIHGLGDGKGIIKGVHISNENWISFDMEEGSGAAMGLNLNCFDPVVTKNEKGVYSWTAPYLSHYKIYPKVT